MQNRLRIFKRSSGIFGISSLTLIFSLTGGCANSKNTTVRANTAEPSQTVSVTQAGYKDQALPVEERVKLLLSTMTIDEKVGQMVQAESWAASPDDVKKYFIGSLLSGGGDGPYDQTFAGWKAHVEKYQKASMSTRLGIPIIYGIDAVHGLGKVKGAVVFPHNIGLGAANNPELMKKIGQITAQEMIQSGITWSFSPCVAVSRDERWGRTYESMSEDPELVSNLSAAYICGLQDGNKIAACAKHFVGDGGTTYGTGDSEFLIDQGNTEMSEEDLRNIHLKPYQAAVKVGVYSIMPSFSSFNGLKMSANKKLMTDVLKTEMGFSGFLISDYKAIYELRNLSYHEQVVASINAGMDMLMEPTDWKNALNVLKDAVNKGEITKERIDDAVKRILTVKFQTGLFEKPLGDESFVKSSTGSKEHRDVAKQAVKESLVLLKNDNKILPLSKNAKVLVLGPAADNIGVQCGGWTMSWQGKMGKITEGSTILDGIKNIVSSSGGTVYTDIKDASKASVVILAIGEKPYAEGLGDEKNLDLYSGLAIPENRKAIEDAKSTKLPIVTILVSGRPRILTNELPSWNALVAAWLPGTEGDAVSDVLFGNTDFKGKLPMTWPKDMSQIPVNKGDAGEKDALFPFGYGMSTK